MCDSRVAVVVLNWNGAEDTIECLGSLRNSSGPVCSIVVDNSSTDDSVERIERSRLADRLIVNPQNLGFAEGNNVGIRAALEAGFRYIAVLNNDTVVEQGWIAALLEGAEHLEPCALSPLIAYYDTPAETWFGGGIVDQGWPRHLQRGELALSEQPSLTETLSGCCIFASADVWRRVGLFDPDYFLIFEDSDWSVRAHRAGVSLYVVPTSIIRHHVSRTLGRGTMSLVAAYYFVRNGLIFVSRHFPDHRRRFVWRWLLRPTATSPRRRRGYELLFRWLGGVGFLVGQRGRAPSVVESVARRVTDTRKRAAL